MLTLSLTIPPPITLSNSETPVTILSLLDCTIALSFVGLVVISILPG